MQAFTVVGLVGLAGVGAMKYHGAVTGETIRALVPEWEVEASRAEDGSDCAGEPVEKQLAQRAFTLPSHSPSVGAAAPVVVRPVTENQGSSTTVSVDISGAAMCPAGTSVITAQVKATLSFVGSRCAAQAIEATPTSAAATPLAGQNRHLLWTGPREAGQFRLRSETYASCTDGRTYRVSELPVSQPSQEVRVASASGGGNVGDQICQFVASCGIVLAVACNGPVMDAAASCCAKIIDDRNRIERQICQSQERQRRDEHEPPAEGDLLERVGEAARRTAEAVGAVVVVVVGGVIWIFTGGQWVPSY